MSDVSGTLETAADLSLCAVPQINESAAPQAIIDGKRCFDAQAAMLGILILAPLLVTIALILLVLQGRPVLIRHRRIGRNGAVFPCLKFRTMVRDADTVLHRLLASDPALRQEWDESRKLRRDPRITAFGRLLRESSIDEIPQIFNVLRGHMSLVGPRPIVADEVPLYGPKITQYYKVRPGLTGAWQVGGRSDVSFARRVELDTAYVVSRSFRADLRILVKTVPVVLGRKGSR
ncbi:sugar transferase [Lichenihabitans sp. Uapishka_5]|uniref:sugar transferase n=1 Tax=Lichenihabitans sp. Uapishka_5 TaxID=3037302 RepID=UPI0029E7D3B7|nr:sugar transferase [Lichenihabitans sp. Uapishka_5]MDX7950398.1 sugar transferase [Lichenihabitans sp. Uapishka_5]